MPNAPGRMTRIQALLPELRRSWPLGAGFVFLSAALLLAAWRAYAAFNGAALDLGVFLSFLYHLSQGGQLDPHGMVSWPMLADNFTLDWYPIALFYRLYPHALTVLILQAVALGSIPLLVALIWRRERPGMPWGQALLLPLATLSPVIWSTDLFPGHPDFLIPVGILLAHYRYLGRRRLDAATAALLLTTLGAKEVAALPVMAYGGYLLLKYRAREGWWIIGAAAAWLTGALVLLAAWHVGRIGHFAAMYGRLLGHHDRLVPGLAYLLGHPWVPLDMLVSPRRLVVLLVTVMALGGLPLLGRAALPGWLALLAFNLLSSRPPQSLNLLEYGMWPLPLLLLGTADGLASLAGMRRPRLPLGVAVALAASALYLALPRVVGSGTMSPASVWERAQLSRTMREFPHASVLTSFSLDAYVANRRRVHILPPGPGSWNQHTTPRDLQTSIRTWRPDLVVLDAPDAPRGSSLLLAKSGYVLHTALCRLRIYLFTPSHGSRRPA